MHIYLLKQAKLYKIGITENPEARFKRIAYDTSNSVKVLFCEELSNAKSLESKFKLKFKPKQRLFKGSGKTEWFELGRVDVLSILLELNLNLFKRKVSSAVASIVLATGIATICFLLSLIFV